VSKKATYCVCSVQANETNDFGRMPVPAEFKTLEEAELYRRELNLRRGAYHPGYVIREKEESSPLLPLPHEDRDERS
jgi:hypothetical protein